MNDIVRTELHNKVEYRLNGQLHRDDGPAIEFTYGSKAWYVEGQRYSEEEFNLVKLSSTNQEADC